MAEAPCLSVRDVRRLALLKAGLLRPREIGLPDKAGGSGKAAERKCFAVVEHFGYLQLDSVAVTGARTHGIVLASRLAGLNTGLPEQLLRPGTPLFEYWGHEACWLPVALYPTFAFRRKEYAVHPWWGDLLNEQPRLVRSILDRARIDGPFKSVDLEGEQHPGWWNVKLAKRVAEALWSAGQLAIAKRSGFQRTYDLTERVIPADVLANDAPEEEAYRTLLLRALLGHGFATTGLLAATWRLRNRRPKLEAAMAELVESGDVVAAQFDDGERRQAGWLAVEDLARLEMLRTMRVRADNGVLLSPFDPVLWDRARVMQLFGFEQVLEIYKPAAQRQYGYYCMPVLAGEQLIGRVDLKADRRTATLSVKAVHKEPARARDNARNARAMEIAIERFAGQTGLSVELPG